MHRYSIVFGSEKFDCGPFEPALQLSEGTADSAAATAYPSAVLPLDPAAWGRLAPVSAPAVP